jgi:hypothetical protein
VPPNSATTAFLVEHGSVKVRRRRKQLLLAVDEVEDEATTRLDEWDVDEPMDVDALLRSDAAVERVGMMMMPSFVRLLSNSGNVGWIWGAVPLVAFLPSYATANRPVSTLLLPRLVQHATLKVHSAGWTLVSWMKSHYRSRAWQWWNDY